MVERFSPNYIKFLGTAGARFVMIKQLRASGGIWLALNETNILIDPGPGTLVKCLSSKPKLDPSKLDAIILTHRHLDHSGDINLMVEAMTDGGFKRRGAVFAPQDALGEDPVILKYIRKYPEKLEVLKEKGSYSIGKVRFTSPVVHIHGVQTYGLEIASGNNSISLIVDTQYFKGLENSYHGKILIINTVLYEPKAGLEHLSLPDAEKIIKHIKPKTAILTHFGMTMLRHKPHELAMQLEEKLGIHTIAAYDGMRFDL